MSLIFRTRKVVKPGDLNSRNTLFGGRLLEWIDEECGIYAACQMETHTLVTKSMTELNFLAPARQGDVVEIGVETVDIGHCTITVTCHVRIKHTKQEIISIDEIVFVNVDDNGRPMRHGKYVSKNDIMESKVSKIINAPRSLADKSLVTI